MRELFTIDGIEHLLFVSRSDFGFRIHMEDGVLEARREAISDTTQRLHVDGTAYEITIAGRGDRLYVHFDGSAYDIAYFDPVSRFAGDTNGSAPDHLRAPMPGAVIACAVEPGDDVEAGDLLMVIESMKIETAFKAWRAGRIEAVHRLVGQTFDLGAPLLSMAALEVA